MYIYIYNKYIYVYEVGLLLYKKDTKTEWFRLIQILFGAKRCYPTGQDAKQTNLCKICGLFGRPEKFKSLEYKLREAKELYILSMFSFTTFCWDMKPSVCDHRNYTIISVKSVW